mgnify:CR=1 FL=1
MTRIVLDTSVIIEYIDRKGILHEQAKIIFNAILKGKLAAIIPHPVLSETYYVATRIYRFLGLNEPEQRAVKLVEWLYHLPTISIRGLDLDLVVEVGLVKMKYGLALTDCYVLASSKVYGGKAVFKKREREMLKHISEIEKNYQVVFLEDYA